MKAGNPEFTEATRKQIEYLRSLGWYHSIELPGGEVIRGFQTPEQLRHRLRQFPIPQDLTGKRVLDIGAWDGWFSFEMEKRGASVVAADLVRSEKFLLARDLLHSKVEYVVSDVYDLRPATLGYFDIVLFFGVLYHLKHPLLGLERVCALSTDLVCVESYVTDDGTDPGAKPSMEFYETTELCGQFDNWTGPNTACLLAFCRTAGFVDVKLESVLDNRAHVTCHRRWPTAQGTGAAPYIVSVEHSAAHDEYLSVWFKAAEGELTAADVFVEIDGYAAAPALLYSTGGDGWHAIVKLPAGNAEGGKQVRLRVRGSVRSNAARIDATTGDKVRGGALAVPDAIAIEIVADGKTWERNQVRSRPDACVSLWIRGLPEGCRTTDVQVSAGGNNFPCVFLSEQDPAGLRQVNALLPLGLAPGKLDVRVAVKGAVSPPAALEVLAE